MIKINLFYSFMFIALMPLYAMENNGKKIYITGEPCVANQPEPEYVQLWKEWMQIKDSKVPHFPFRDAQDNVDQLKWLVQKRKEELSQKKNIT